MPASLFSEFDPMDKKAWEKQAAKELKEKFSSSAYWEIGSGLNVASYYTSEELDAEKSAEMQQCQKKSPGWSNVPSIDFEGAPATNLLIRNALENGADAIFLNLGNASLAECEFPKLLHGVRLSDTPIFFQTAENPVDLFSQISKNAGYYLKGGISFDPIANWMRTGKRFETYLESIGSVLTQTKNMREFRPFMVETHLYHNNGADPVQELSLAIAATVTYMDLLTDAGISPLLAFNRILFSVSIGPQYLTEIAKLRAFRFLLRKVSRAYMLPDELCTPFIHAKTSSFFNVVASPYTNMVRASSEAMSAVIGGCNALTVLRLDENSGPNEFSARIARNVSSVLTYESGLAAVADPSAGSYLLENISISLAEAAWEAFLNIEDKGGLITCFENGMIGDELKKSLDQKISSLSEGKVMIGVNKFIEPETSILPKEKDATQVFSSQLRDKNLSECFKNRSDIS